MKPTNRMKMLFTLLSETSQFSFHSSNMAKEYVLLESGEYLISGYDCFKKAGNYYKVNDDNSVLIKEKYVECYGVSIANIVYLLEKKSVKVLSIHRLDGKKFVIFVMDQYGNPRQYSFTETTRLENFSESDMCYFLLDLYDIL